VGPGGPSWAELAVQRDGEEVGKERVCEINNLVHERRERGWCRKRRRRCGEVSKEEYARQCAEEEAKGRVRPWVSGIGGDEDGPVEPPKMARWRVETPMVSKRGPRRA
jgi:hypothetical protein